MIFQVRETPSSVRVEFSLTPQLTRECLDVARRLENLHPERRRHEDLARLGTEQRSLVETYLDLHKERRPGFLRLMLEKSG
jgi:hypothetical protein